MKKILLLLVFLPLLSFSQVKPIQTYKIADKTTSFGQNLPSGTFIFDMSSLRPFQLKVPATSSNTLSDNIAVEIVSDTGITVLDSSLIIGGRFWQSGLGNSVFIGEDAGLNDDLSTNNNVAIGYKSLESNSSGAYNVAIGSQTMNDNTSGVYNTAIGHQSLVSNSTGMSNVAMGYRSLQYNTIGGYNTAIGYRTLTINSTGEQNTAIGSSALANMSWGKYNTGIGVYALKSDTSGNSNTAIGYGALERISKGNDNIGIGLYAGKYVGSSTIANHDAENSIFIGKNTRAQDTSQNHQIVIGPNATGNGSYTFTLGCDSITDVYAGQNGNATIHASSIRLTILQASLSMPPTAAELTALIGDPATLGAGHTTFVYDTTNAVFYIAITDGITWLH